MTSCVDLVNTDVIIIISSEKAIQKIQNINPNFIILSEFKGWRENITRQCKVCGDIRTVHARCLIEKKKNGELRRCPACIAKEQSKLRRKSHEQFVHELNQINCNIKILGKYVNTSTKILCQCLIDGCEWMATPHTLLEGHGCPECSHRKQNWRTNEKFIEEMKQKHPPIIPLEEYVNANKSIKFHCNKCGYEWQTSPNILLTKEDYGCPKCNGYAPVTEQEMIDRLAIVNPNIEYVNGYRGIVQHANFHCKICGHDWHTPPNSVLHGRGCPICNMSRGEEKIKNFLDSLKISYERQYKFENCKDIKQLPFDFYILHKNMCIEYDGEQHFIPVRFGKNETELQIMEKFTAQQKRDQIKNEYCEKNNIMLIRIPYTEYQNIENILNKYLA